MKTKTKITTARITRILTIISAALVTFTGGLALLPIDSADLPMPPAWRPYLAGTALLVASLRILVIPTLDSIIKKLKETENPPP
jgi:hypothetical protein